MIEVGDLMFKLLPALLAIDRHLLFLMSPDVFLEIKLPFEPAATIDALHRPISFMTKLMLLQILLLSILSITIGAFERLLLLMNSRLVSLESIYSTELSAADVAGEDLLVF